MMNPGGPGGQQIFLRIAGSKRREYVFAYVNPPEPLLGDTSSPEPAEKVELQGLSAAIRRCNIE